MPADHSSIAAETQRHRVADALLGWYDLHHRSLPWRVPPDALRDGVRPDPYRVWLSEVMLQQTTVEAVRGHFARFTEQWPDFASLAAAESDAVMKAWAGLGYYSRARNLKKCADLVAGTLGGALPSTEADLRRLPGIGAYTAAAIAAIAFGRQSAVVDGNVERVVTRLFAIDRPLPSAKPAIAAAVAAMVPADRPGDFAQATMDLGATICTPRRPACLACPLADGCLARLSGDPERFPVKPPRRERPLRLGAAFVARSREGAILLRRRPDRGLLAGMAEVPTSGWSARIDGVQDVSAAPFAANWRIAGPVEHVFTHFSLRLTVHSAEVGSREAPPGHWWSPPGDLPGEALPTLVRKAIEAAYPGATDRNRDTDGRKP